MSVLLWLITVHSYIVVLVLIISPFELINVLGIKLINERFFPGHGGMFHIVMRVCYTLATRKLERHKGLIILSMIVKFTDDSKIYLKNIFNIIFYSN